MDAKDLLEHLKKNATTRAQKTLDAVYKVCEGQVERGIFDFSYVTISRLGKGLKVPRAQSIRNAAGEPYRLLIQAFIDASPGKRKLKGASHPDAWVDNIADHTQRYLTRVLMSELAEARRVLSEIIPPSMEIVVDDRTSVISNVKGDFKLTGSESNALKYLISDEFLLQHGFVRGVYGDVMKEDGKKVFKPGTIDALNKALKFL